MATSDATVFRCCWGASLWFAVCVRLAVCFAEQIPDASLILLVPTEPKARQSDQPGAWWNTTRWLDFPAQTFTWQDLQVEQVSGANGASNTDLNTINENQQNVKRTGRCAHWLGFIRRTDPVYLLFLTVACRTSQDPSSMSKIVWAGLKVEILWCSYDRYYMILDVDTITIYNNYTYNYTQFQPFHQLEWSCLLWLFEETQPETLIVKLWHALTMSQLQDRASSGTRSVEHNSRDEICLL